MTWMLTATGTSVELQMMDHASIRILDIAHHLAQINRFTGACRRPYSVAEHSLLVCSLAETLLGERDPEVLLCALMHDAHEAYTNDLSQPYKQLLGESWSQQEKRIQAQVLARFALLAVYHRHRPRIQRCDLTALSTERVALMPAGGPAWMVNELYPAVAWDFAAVDTHPWTHWRDAFLKRFDELHFARCHRRTPA